MHACCSLQLKPPYWTGSSIRYKHPFKNKIDRRRASTIIINNAGDEENKTQPNWRWKGRDALKNEAEFRPNSLNPITCFL